MTNLSCLNIHWLPLLRMFFYFSIIYWLLLLRLFFSFLVLIYICYLKIFFTFQIFPSQWLLSTAFNSIQAHAYTDRVFVFCTFRLIIYCLWEFLAHNYSFKLTLPQNPPLIILTLTQQLEYSILLKYSIQQLVEYNDTTKGL